MYTSIYLYIYICVFRCIYICVNIYIYMYHGASVFESICVCRALRAEAIKDSSLFFRCPSVWSPSSGLGHGQCPLPSSKHIGILLNIPDQIQKEQTE